MATAFIDDQSPILASLRRPGASDDCYRIWAEGPVLRIEAQGEWDLLTARAYTDDIARIVADLRQSGCQLRAIADRRNLSGFDPAVGEHLLNAYRQILQEGDRIAMLVNSSLVKMNLRRIAGREETQAFLSIAAARLWVLAYG